MTLPRFDYAAPRSLDEASRLLREAGAGARLIAGGTDLLMKIGDGRVRVDTLVALRKVDGLREISVGKAGLRIGATARLAEVGRHPDVCADYPALAEAAGHTATVQIRNMGTVVGNVCNGSPAGDNIPTLVAMNAVLSVVGADGERCVPLSELYTGPQQTTLALDDVASAVEVPPAPPHTGVAYHRLSARGQVDICGVSAAAWLTLDGDLCREVRIVLGGVAPTPIRARAAEVIGTGERLTPDLATRVGAAAVSECAPISDLRATESYRRRLVGVLVARALLQAGQRARS